MKQVLTFTECTARVLCRLAVLFPLAAMAGEWPDFVASMMPAHAESPTLAVLPDGVRITAPEAAVPAQRAAFSGTWRGWACRGWQCDVALAVESVSTTGARLVYARGVGREAVRTLHLDAVFEGDELHAPFPTGGRRLELRLRARGVMEMLIRGSDGDWLAVGVLTRGADGRGVVTGGVVTQDGLDYTRHVERLPTPWTHEGTVVALETVFYLPPQAGPLPTVVVHHGSTGRGNDPQRFGHTWTNVPLARWFTARGWQVVFPQRRGRGGSDSDYAEGLAGDGSGYSCTVKVTLDGAERALEDLRVVTTALRARSDVDARRLVVAGVSRGGALALALAGERPADFAGVVNFVGGWMGEACPDSSRINQTLLTRGATFDRPTLWLYGKRDPYYSIAHSRRNFDAFRMAGGQGSFLELEPPPRGNGHFIFAVPQLWAGAMDAYLKTLVPRQTDGPPIDR